MTNELTHYWDETAQKIGHTGFSEKWLYALDQPVRLRAITRLLQTHLTRHAARHQALDLGCGTGDIIQLLAGLGFQRIDACDVSRVVLADARARFHGNPNVRFFHSPIETLGLPAGQYDLITAITVFQHVVADDLLEKTLRHLYAGLKKGGVMLALEVSPNQRRYGSDFYLTERTRGQYVRLLKSVAPDAECLSLPYSPLAFTMGNMILPSLLSAFQKQDSGARGQSARTERSESAPSMLQRPASLARHVLRFGYSPLRKMLMLVVWPVDFIYPFTFPERFVYYHFFVVKKGGET